jgi:SAM-dependent methyltransferase
MRCPACESPVDGGTGRCTAGHDLRDTAGVIRLVGADLAAEAAALEDAVWAHRRGLGTLPLPPSALAALPFGPATTGDHEWRIRRADLVLLRRHLADRRAVAVLDIGAWNGWLSARLAADGQRVTATELFAGPNSLGAHAHAISDWRAVQVDPEDLDRLEERYELVILNHCLQFAPDPIRLLRAAARRALPGGHVIAIGLQVFRSPGQVAARIASDRARFRDEQGRELSLRPTKGYFDGDDLVALEAEGLRTRWYPDLRLRLANLRARLDAGRPEHRFGVLDA